jgi:hypothetical protein
MVTEFLETLFSPDLGGSFIEVRLVKSGEARPMFFKSVDGVLKGIAKTKSKQGGFNVYFGVCPRSCRKGTKDAVKAVGCLWIDLDAKDLNGDKAEALKRLREFPYPPSTIVDSGHGYHAYWLLKEVIEITEPEDVILIESYLGALSDALGADRSAAELARILRLPGTFNVKDPSAPMPVEIVLFEPKRRYNLIDFDDYLPIGPPEQPQIENRPGWIAESLANLRDGNRNVTFARIGGRLHHDGWTPDDILALLKPHADKTGFPVVDLRKEIEGLCRRYPRPISSPFPSPSMGETEAESRPMIALPLPTFLEQAPVEILWSLQGILPKEGAGIIAGPAGYGKSWTLQDLAIEVARGGKWLGQFPTSQGRVLYLDEESSPALLSHRLRKLLIPKEVSVDELDLHIAVGQGLSFSQPASVDQLRALMADLRPALVIVDSLIRVHGAEENSATEMAKVFQAVKDLIREFGCAFLFADHQRKPNNFSTSLDLLLRGTSEKAAFVDTLLSLRRKDGTLIVEHSKSRFAEPVPAFVVLIEDMDEDSTTIKYGGEAEEIKKAARLEEATDFLESVMKGKDWLTRKEIVSLGKEARMSVKVLDETLKALEGHQIEREDRKPESRRGGKAAFYRWKNRPITFPSPLLNSGEMETESETHD